ncbi:MAG: hypothetical protein ACTSRP_12400 [Candidatus Helarchaeota archaeon]
MKPKPLEKFVVIKEYSNREELEYFVVYRYKGENIDVYEKIGIKLKEKQIRNRGIFYVFKFKGRDYVIIRKFVQGIPIHDSLPYLSSVKIFYLSHKVISILYTEAKRWLIYDR